jgi:hypothetical protein
MQKYYTNKKQMEVHKHESNSPKPSRHNKTT